MSTDLYNGVAVVVIACQLESEVPYLTVGGLLDHAGWVDLVQTIRTVYPKAFRAMCAQHHEAIQAGLKKNLQWTEVDQ